ncbi:hypothetical protein KIN20_014157 [Parelaphostrongylus tenuis]|uniref:Uncharacterized protein n=1 Tax=Parelaphostrongylus tenuis TaxID=148309 RepID=A0AAD5MZ41_PARTN|nr:hypothetical protein KIN20_014157 [Parelaphostrongylus tenuis]
MDTDGEYNEVGHANEIRDGVFEKVQGIQEEVAEENPPHNGCHSTNSSSVFVSVKTNCIIIQWFQVRINSGESSDISGHLVSGQVKLLIFLKFVVYDPCSHFIDRIPVLVPAK